MKKLKMTNFLMKKYFSGNTFENEPVHSVWAYNEKTKWAALVTVYRPDPAKWINWQRRK